MAGRQLNNFMEYLRHLSAPRQAVSLGDGVLVARFVREQDQAAFEALLGRHGPMIWTVCRRLLFDPHEAEDAFQATWLVFVRRAATIRQPDNLATWLYGVAHKVAARARAQALRRQARRHGDASSAFAATEDPAVLEANRLLHEELDKLPLKYRAPLVLCYLEGRRQEEAAAMLGWSRGTIHGRLERGRNCLRGRLQRRGIGLSVAGVAAALEANATAALLPPGLARATTAALLSFITNPGTAQQATSAAAVALTEGVCRTMQLAKFKFVALFVLAASLVGGAGLLAGRGFGPDGVKDSAQVHRTGPAEKQKPAGPQPKPKTPPAKPTDAWQGQVATWPQPSNTWQVDWAHDLQEARRLEMDLDEHETAWASELGQARRELLIAQEQLRRIQEREQERIRRSRAEEEHAEQDIQSRQAHVEALKNVLKVQSGKVTVQTPDQTLLANAKDGLNTALVKLHQIQRESDKEQQIAMERRVQARLAVMTAQDRLDQIERRQARKRDQLQADLDLIQERIRRARWGFPPIGAGQDDRLERKVDQLRQQIEALRRQLRPHMGGTAAKP